MKRIFLYTTFFALFFTFSVNSKELDCKPEFYYQNGWYGGDAAYSVPINNTNKTLWLFGDTFVGEKDKNNRSGTNMISNSIGISECDNENWKIDYFWRTDNNIHKPFFTSTSEKIKDWPLDGFVYNKKLYLILEQIKILPDGGAFGFELSGTKIAIVDNYEDNPNKWNIKYINLTEGNVVFPGVSTVIKENHVYLFSVLDSEPYKKTHPMVLARIQLNKLNNASTNIEYLNKDNKWEHKFDVNKVKQVMEKGSNEMTVRYNPQLNKWVAVYNKQGDFLSNQLAIRVSNNLEDNWSEEIYNIFFMPEMKLTSPDYDNETFCYAGKEHIQYRKKGSLLITYACNTFSLDKLISNMNIYVPKSVYIKLPN